METKMQQEIYWPRVGIPGQKKNGQVGQHKTATKVAAALEMSTH